MIFRHILQATKIRNLYHQLLSHQHIYTSLKIDGLIIYYFKRRIDRQDSNIYIDVFQI